MPFQIPEIPERKTFEKVQFLKLTPGTHLVRLLEDPSTAKIVYSHFVMGKFTIECPGEDCPICLNNKRIIFEHKDDFRDQPGYSQKSTHYMLNVLDRTSTKICPNCQMEIKMQGIKDAFPPQCPGCNAFITKVEPHPLNKVKLLSFGVKLAKGMNNVEKTVCDPSGEPIGLLNFDLNLVVDGVKREKEVTPIPVLTNNDVLDVPLEAYQDRDNATLKLSPDEVLDLLRGVSLRDIFSSRRGKKLAPSQEAVTDTPPWEKADTSGLAEAVNSILDN